ncbi:MAG: LysE family translocator [Xanthobacteraceae bacterium]|jgi:threonine/homoserine/homoserine lactone efflux protein
MDLAALLIFAGALVVAAASPGPAIAVLVGRVIGRGPEGAGAFAAGLIIGDLVWLAVAVLGLAVVAQTFHEVFLVIKYAGAAYLIYLAYRMWTAPVAPGDVAAATRGDRLPRLFLAGLALTLGNPKVVAFYLALLPNLIDLASVGVLGYAELAAICVGILIVVYGGYVVAAVRARALFRSSRAMRLLNRAGGTMIAGAAVAVATK